MADDSKLSRRDMIKRSLLISGVAAGAGAFLSACGDDEEEAADFSCTDTSGLTEQEVQVRQQLGYVDRTPNPNKNCLNCNFYQAPAEPNSCGGCQIMKGPVHPEGYCNSWAAKQT